MIEIERKFLVEGTDWTMGATPVRIRQGYLCVDEDRTVRVRSTDQQSWLTIKGRDQGRGRPEFEFEIPGPEADELLNTLCIPPVLEKTRHTLTYADHTWEVDEFHGQNEGLIIAEIELNSMEEPFEIPPWAGREVTGDPAYYNASLIQHPFNTWK